MKLQKVRDVATVTKCMNIDRISTVKKKMAILLLYFNTFCDFVCDLVVFIILQLCQFCISSMLQQGIQILQIEDKTTIINDTSYQIYYRPQLSISKPCSGEEVKHCGYCFYLSSAVHGCLGSYGLNCI